VEVVFSDDAIEEIASIADRVNQQTENIGARRLYTILERLLDDLSFRASDMDMTDAQVTIDRQYVVERLENIVSSEDMTRYIL
jgi:ATP-dependent HslUV protease ATP-binding subunit HslU